MTAVIDADRVRDYEGDPLVLFLGVSTAGSGVHSTFPGWAPLFLPGAVLRGVDLPEDAPAPRFRELVTAMRENPRVLAAVVTSHKLRLYRACADLLTAPDALVTLTHEINSLDTRGGIAAFARDPQSLDVLFADTASPLALATTPRPVLCIGSGGSATALLLAMGLDVPASLVTGEPLPRAQGASYGHLTIAGRRPESLEELRDVQHRCGIPDAVVRLELVADDDATGRLVASAAPGTVVANATGLGKTVPGSPLPAHVEFPEGALAWDFNYRGPLTFLEQARSQGVAVVDGWDYFVAGWSAALAAVSAQELTRELFGAALAAAEPFRP